MGARGEVAAIAGPSPGRPGLSCEQGSAILDLLLPAKMPNAPLLLVAT